MIDVKWTRGHSVVDSSSSSSRCASPHHCRRRTDGHAARLGRRQVPCRARVAQCSAIMKLQMEGRKQGQAGTTCHTEGSFTLEALRCGDERRKPQYVAMCRRYICIPLSGGTCDQLCDPMRHTRITVAVRLVANCLLYTSPSPRDRQKSRMPSSA